MDWYYYSNQTQTGPVSEEDFNELVNSGTITADTLVWHSGLSEWSKYGSLVSPQGGAPMVAAEGEVTCSECGRSFAEDDVIRHGESIICEDCKPMFLQKLKDGSWDKGLTGAFRYGGFWIRAGAKIIDWIILSILQWTIFIPAGMLMGSMDDPNVAVTISILMNLVSVVIQVGYTTFFLGKYSATPGKMACGLKVVVADGSKISYLRAFGRVFAEMLSGIILGIGYIMAGFDKEKRSLHDRICSTRVVRK